MKKLALILLSLTLVLTFAACGGTPAASSTGTISDSGPAADDIGRTAVPTGSSDEMQEPSVGPAEIAEKDPADVQAEEPAPAAAPETEAPPAAVTSTPVNTPAPAPAPAEQPSAPAEVKSQPAPQAEPEPAPAPQPEPAEKPAPTVSDASAYIGQSASALISALGQPNSTDYASSCLGEGEDGELRYNGFTVYTYRENGVETVQAVE